MKASDVITVNDLKKAIGSLEKQGGAPPIALVTQGEWDWLPDSHKQDVAGKKEILLESFPHKKWVQAEVTKPLEL